jgi:hypothetical protein
VFRCAARFCSGRYVSEQCKPSRVEHLRLANGRLLDTAVPVWSVPQPGVASLVVVVGASVSQLECDLEALGLLQLTLAANEKISWTGGFGVNA